MRLDIPVENLAFKSLVIAGVLHHIEGKLASKMVD
jgi:hypothetical protein